jgi:hypothetical protein
MDNKKVLTLMVLSAFVFAILLESMAFVAAADSGVNMSALNITLFSGRSNNSLISTSGQGLVLINFTIQVNQTGQSLNGSNFSYFVDNNAGAIFCNTTATSNATPVATPHGNASGCLFDGTVNQLYLNLTEGEHFIWINVTFGNTSHSDTRNTTWGAGNSTFHVVNLDSLAFAANNTLHGGNLSINNFTVYTQFNSSVMANLTFRLWNFTLGQNIFNTSWNFANNLTNYTAQLPTNQSMMNGSNLSYYNHSWAPAHGGDYQYNITFFYNVTGAVMDDGVDNFTIQRSIFRTITIDLLAPNVTLGTQSCTGWYDEGNGHVEKDTTFTCTCGIVDENDTSASATPTGIDTTTLDTRGVSCNGADSASNNATSGTVTYHVISLGGGASSGGGGGGGSSGSSITGSTFTVNEEQLAEGSSASLKAGDGFSANFKASGQASSRSHTIKVNEVSDSSAVITISSEPIQFKLNVGTSKRVDVDGDGIYDISVTLDGVTDGKADITIIEKDGEVPEGQGPVEGGTGLEEPEQPTQPVDDDDDDGKSGLGALLWIIIVVIIIIIIAAVVMNTKKKK